jgi:hypothetical protein
LICLIVNRSWINRPQAAACDLERLPSEIRVDCIRLVTGPFRAGVEDSMRRLREALAAVLRRKVSREGVFFHAISCHRCIPAAHIYSFALATRATDV